MDQVREEEHLGIAQDSAAPVGRAADLLPPVYEELRHLAGHLMASKTPGQTLQATALVHEAFLRLSRGQPQQWQSPRQFYSAAAEAMRRVLIGQARRKGSLRRGGTKRQTGIFNLKGESVWQPEPDRAEAEVNCFREMFAAMQAGNPINDSLSMARSTMLAILGRMATHSGQRVTWDEAYASNLALAPKRYAWDADPPVMPKPDDTYPHPVPGVTKVL